MPQFLRYAIYYTPAPGPLASFGAAWLGWDIASGTSVPHPVLPNLPAPISEITHPPRRYGLHATVVPPFHLAAGCTAQTLHDAFEHFCSQAQAAPIGLLELAQLGRFLALVPTQQAPALTQLAAQAVQEFNVFRAPLSEADIQRRDQPNLTVKQRETLLRWGYPYVMDQFRFHMTLTGKRPKAQTTDIHAALAPVLAPLLTTAQRMDALSLVGQDESGRFHTIARSALMGP
ncbi:DUF1045 domain-containing protein [Roseovarius aestuarii]|nr:DUF1045 domain-containing protein [Roseovarius aestuarii]